MKQTATQNSIRSLLIIVASGHDLTPDDIAEIKMADDIDQTAFERRLRSAARAVASLKDEGRNGDATNLARQHALEITNDYGFPVEPRDPIPTDPAELAAMVSQF